MKRTLSLFLSFLMLIGCIAPLTAFAADPAAVTLHACDAASGFTAKSATLTPQTGTYHGEANQTALMGKGTPGTIQLIASWSPVDLSAYKPSELFLHFWFYIADASAKNGGGQIELTSSGTSDKEELNWYTNDFSLVDGWNEYLIPFEFGNDTGLNFSGLNYFRMYLKLGKEVDIGMDQIEILIQKDEEAADSSSVHVISKCDKATDVSTGLVQLSPKEVTLPDGTKSTALMGDRPQSDKTETISVRFSAMDLSEYPDEDIFLHFWFYISDASAYKSNTQIELCSGGNCDIEEAHWWTSYYPYKTGWNEYLLPLSKADFSSSTTGVPFNKSHVNYFRFYFTLSKAVTIGIDNIEVLTVHQQSYEERFDNGTGGLTAAGASLSAANGKLKVAMQNASAVIGKDVPLNTLRPGTGVVSFDLSPADAVTGGEVRILDANGRKAVYAFSSANFKSGRFHSFLSDTTSRDDGFSFGDASRFEIELKGKQGASVEIGTIRVMDVSEELNNRIIDVSGELTFNTLDTCAPVVEGIRADFDRLVNMINFNPDNLATDYVPSYFVLQNMEKEIAAYRDAKKNGLLTTVTTDRQVLTSGEPIRLTLNLQNIGSGALNDLKYEITYNDLYLKLTSGNEKGSVSVAAGKDGAVTFGFSALTGGVSDVTVKVTDAAGKKLAEHKVRLTVDGVGYYSADCHSHSTVSDGSPTLAHNFRSAYEKGMAFIYTADHNATLANNYDVAAADQIMKDSGYADFLTVKGSEITVYDANGHLLKYNCNIDFSTLPTGITDADKALWQEIMTKIVEDGGYAYLAHPFHLWYNFPGLTSGEMAALGKNGYSTWANGGWLTARDKDFYRPADGIRYYHGYTGVEIMNWMKGEEKYHSEAVLEYWDRMNILGEKKYYGIGNSDAHETKNIAMNYNTFLLNELTEEEIHNALGNGRLYVTNGPEMRMTLDGKTFGQTVIVGGTESKTLKLTAKTSGLPIKEIVLYRYEIQPDMAKNDQAYAAGVKTVLYSQGSEKKYEVTLSKELSVKPGEFYRVEVLTGSYDNIAFSNPIWIASATDSFSFTNKVEKFAKGEHRVISWSVANLYDTPHLSSASEYVSALDNGRIEVAANAPDGYYVVTAKTESGKNAGVIIQVGNPSGALPEIVFPDDPGTPDVPDIPEVPETDAPETDVPETDAPETKAPGTDAPETEAPGTEAETKGGDETQSGSKDDGKPNIGLIAGIAAGVLAAAAAALLLLKKRKAK
ncbi:MAG: CehA/McbA family metallohydrolase [Lachnospiraceae bacterium]|nr:CehA/McbA family metallohydrolase [Lachnospiraceae bacterium]